MKKAFTLIELLIFMGILAALLGILSQILASALAVQVESQTASSVHSDGRYLLSRLTYDVRRASNITSPASAGLTSPTLTLTISGSPYIYALSGTDLQLTTPSSTDNLNSFATQVSAFSVSRLGNSNGEPTITVSFTVTDRSVSENFQTTISTRTN